MDIKRILAACDHTLLDRCATRADIFALCDEGIAWGVASVCIPAAYVRDAKKYVGDRLKICTVVGFPNGYTSTEAKAQEVLCALSDGADEIDTVIHIGALKEGRDSEVEAEIARLKSLCGDCVLKVIVETCYLTEEEKIRACGIVTRAGADFIKTSTGFGTGGATREDVALFARHVGEGVQIKAAGGISSLEDAEDFLALGATRLGTSRLIQLAKQAMGE